MPARDDRLGEEAGKDDHRSHFQQDRDRILYATEFRRLAGVTQVVSPGEGEIFHNRLTHTLKVAQVARRLAEAFLSRPGGQELAEAWGGIDPDVIESAALAHDLGHPPFGHTAEMALNRLVAAASGGDAAGYEGNAQSFRIVSNLSVRRDDSQYGLDLCRATLNATLKYPRVWAAGAKKYNAYPSEQAAFDFARAMAPATDHRCIEAQVMDWADDITYSVHDSEDFYRAGLIPLDRLAINQDAQDWFLTHATERRKGKPFPVTDQNDVDGIFRRLCDALLTREPYTGTRDQRAALTMSSSRLIHRLLSETQLGEPALGNDGLVVSPELRTQVELMKELTWVYVIDNPALATHRYGETQIIEGLFGIYFQSAKAKKPVVFPARFRDDAAALVGDEPDNDAAIARLVADTIASMTDGQARRMYQRLHGLPQSPALDPIIV